MTFSMNPVYCIIANKTYTANSSLCNLHTNCKHVFSILAYQKLFQNTVS